MSRSSTDLFSRSTTSSSTATSSRSTATAAQSGPQRPAFQSPMRMLRIIFTSSTPHSLFTMRASAPIVLTSTNRTKNATNSILQRSSAHSSAQHQADRPTCTPTNLPVTYELRDIKFDDDSTLTTAWIRHKLDSRTIEYAFIGLKSSRSAYTCVHNLTDRIYELRDIMFDQDLTSTSERIRLKGDPYIIQDSGTSTSSFTPSVEAFHMPKEHSKAMVQDNPYEDTPPSGPVNRSVSTGDYPPILLLRAAPYLVPPRSSTRLRKASICNDKACSKRPLTAADPSRICIQHRQIQWAILMHINMLTSPHLVWISSDHHAAAKSVFLLSESKENTFVKSTADFSRPDTKVWRLNKLLYGLKSPKTPWR
jgi:hypothetical protein